MKRAKPTHRALRLIGATDEHERANGLTLGQFELEAPCVEHPLVSCDETAAEQRKDEGHAWSIEEAVACALRSD